MASTSSMHTLKLTFARHTGVWFRLILLVICIMVLYTVLAGKWSAKVPRIAEDLVEQRTYFKSQNGQRQRYNIATRVDLINFHNAKILEVKRRKIVWKEKEMCKKTTQIICPTMVRVGGLAGGGKWTCNPWRLKNTANCIIYSLGTHTDSTFDFGILELTNGNCQIIAFDKAVKFGKAFEHEESIKFFPYFIAKTSQPERNVYSVGDVMKKHGHEFIHILKIDIEGSEYDVMASIFNSSGALLPCQVLIEFHQKTDQFTKWRTLMMDFSKAGYLLFSKEVNLSLRGGLYEYAYIHTSCLEKFGLSQQGIFNRNFELMN